MTYLIHVTVLNEDAISGYSPGRLGQVLYPYFEKDIADGTITEEEVLELLENHRFKFSAIELFASTGISGGISGNTFNNLSLGGLQKNGRPCGNRLEWLILHAGMTVRSLRFRCFSTSGCRKSSCSSVWSAQRSVRDTLPG